MPAKEDRTCTHTLYTSGSRLGIGEGNVSPKTRGRIGKEK